MITTMDLLHGKSLEMLFLVIPKIPKTRTLNQYLLRLQTDELSDRAVKKKEPTRVFISRQNTPAKKLSIGVNCISHSIRVFPCSHGVNMQLIKL